MQLKHLLSAFILASASATVAAAGIESFVGKSPSRLLKQQQPFAKAYRAAVKDHDLPDWTKRLSIGFPAEAVELGGTTLLLTSACSPEGCQNERLYLLYEPARQSITGFFFLPPFADAGDNRMALSRWIGTTPTKERADFLLERAMRDTEGEQRPMLPTHN